MGALDAIPADPRDDRAREAIGKRSRAPDIHRRAQHSRIRSPLRAATPAGRSLLPKDFAGTSTASPDRSPDSSERGPRLEPAGVVDPGNQPLDYAEQMQQRWLDIASKMPQIVEDTYLMGGVPIYRPPGGDKHLGLVLRPNTPLGLALGMKFH